MATIRSGYVTSSTCSSLGWTFLLRSSCHIPLCPFVVPNAITDGAWTAQDSSVVGTISCTIQAGPMLSLTRTKTKKLEQRDMRLAADRVRNRCYGLLRNSSRGFACRAVRCVCHNIQRTRDNSFIVDDASEHCCACFQGDLGSNFAGRSQVVWDILMYSCKRKTKEEQFNLNGQTPRNNLGAGFVR